MFNQFSPVLQWVGRDINHHLYKKIIIPKIRI